MITFCGFGGRAASLSITTFRGGGGCLLPEMVILLGPTGAGGFVGVGGGLGTDPALVAQTEEREEPETRNTIVVNGDILDSEDSGRRLLELINNESLNRGSVITNAGFA